MDSDTNYRPKHEYITSIIFIFSTTKYIFEAENFSRANFLKMLNPVEITK